MFHNAIVVCCWWLYTQLGEEARGILAGFPPKRVNSERMDWFCKQHAVGLYAALTDSSKVCSVRAHFTEDCVDETVRMKISLGEENSMTLVGLPNLVQLPSQDDSDHVEVAEEDVIRRGLKSHHF